MITAVAGFTASVISNTILGEIYVKKEIQIYTKSKDNDGNAGVFDHIYAGYFLHC